MSIEAINWVMNKRDLTDRTEFCVMFALANRTQPEGDVTLSQDRWARESRCSRATLQRTIAKIIAYGWIARDTRPGRSNSYRMLFPARLPVPLIPDHRDRLPDPYLPHGEAGIYPQPASPDDATLSIDEQSNPPHGEAPLPHQMTRHLPHQMTRVTHSDSLLQTHASAEAVDNSPVDTRISDANRAVAFAKIAQLRAQLNGSPPESETDALEGDGAQVVDRLDLSRTQVPR